VKILWHSSAPTTRTGYGIQTREIIRRLIKDGHEVAVATKHEYLRRDSWEGIEIFEGTDTYFVNQLIEREKFDIIFTFWDIWAIWGRRFYPKDRWIAYAPVNTEPLSPFYLEVLQNTATQVAMTRHGERILRESGFSPLYAPHGIDISIFKPEPEMGLRFRRNIGWADDNFVIGLVGLNYSDDVKGVIPLLLAFREFHMAHPEARLFLCTLANEREAVKTCINYHYIVKTLGLEGLVGWPDQLDYFLSRLSEEDLVAYYNGMDVFCLPTSGESFGLPILEAQACGVPVITTDAASGPELCRTGWLIDIDRIDDASWIPVGCWRFRPKPSAILRCLEVAYNAWKWSDYGKLRRLARERVLEYDWDSVWDTHWRPVWQALEAKYGKQA